MLRFPQVNAAPAQQRPLAAPDSSCTKGQTNRPTFPFSSHGETLSRARVLLFLLSFLFFPVVCFVDPSNSSEWSSQVLAGAPGSSLMPCSDAFQSPFFVLLRSCRGCCDDEYANRCTNMQIMQRFSAFTIILDDRETRNHLDEAHSSLHLLQRAIYSTHNRRERSDCFQAVCA